jgi:hypothetical protein
MRIARLWSLAVGVASVCGLIAGAGSAIASPPAARWQVSIGGAVAVPVTYTRAELAGRPQTTVETTRRTWSGTVTHTDVGVSLQALVNIAEPVLPAGAKNPLLRVTVTVEGPFGFPVTVALGELDPNFGNHPAILVLKRDGHELPFGPALVIPGDHTAARSVFPVRTITVGVQSPTTVVPATAGDLTVTDGHRIRVLSASQLAGLPSQTRKVSFLAGASPQTHTEVGPGLVAVLRKAGFPIHRDTWVAAVASDDYVATVTPGEAVFGGRSLQLSLAEDGVALAQPRLVADGDVKGGRYVTGVTKLLVGDGS